MASAKLVSPKEEVDVEVTWVDQQDINLFGRLNMQLHEIHDDLKTKRVALDNLRDVSDELALADDEELVMMSVGEGFVSLPKDEAEAKVTKLQADTESDIAKAEAEVKSIKGKMQELKKKLYAKFGTTINLEDDFEDS
eukprot:TRINITY_DN2954_c0_g2_i1.p1 TRINITY_DN2954_c0_g2~~TRINITY_DN2954_c0_g2_i1.p1  ORF type:complete len:138 (+),score=59.66 TRINITY_DN2954_c0_g2_i1:73-486(+)